MNTCHTPHATEVVIRHEFVASAAATRLRKRFDGMAADQLRAEVARLSEENERLLEERSHLISVADSADWAHDMYSTLEEQNHQLWQAARRAGIDLRLLPIGVTRDGQVGLIGVQS